MAMLLQRKFDSNAVFVLCFCPFMPINFPLPASLPHFRNREMHLRKIQLGEVLSSSTPNKKI